MPGKGMHHGKAPGYRSAVYHEPGTLLQVCQGHIWAYIYELSR